MMSAGRFLIALRSIHSSYSGALKYVHGSSSLVLGLKVNTIQLSAPDIELTTGLE